MRLPGDQPSLPNGSVRRRRIAGGAGRAAIVRVIWRRKWIVAAAVLVAGAIVAALMIGNTAAPPLPLTARPAIVQHERRHVALTAADRRAILAVGRVFVRTAVKRDHPERAWPLASAALRSGTTLADWKDGTLPFPPFPVRGARWNLAYSVVGEVGLDVLVESSDPEVRPLVHRLTLVRNTGDRKPAWLVDGWVPMSSAPGGFVEPPGANPFAVQDMPRTTPSPGRIWVLMPLAILVGAFLLPFAIIANSHRAERRIRRKHARSSPGAN